MAAGACDFWYLTWGDRRSGYLVDLIRRPDQAVARVAIFRRGEAPRLLREVFPRAALQVTRRGRHAGVSLGSWRLDERRCRGQIGGWALSCEFALRAPPVTLVPGWIGRLYPRVPALRSTPGTISHALVTPPAAGAGPAAADQQRDLPCALTRYRVGDIAAARWFLISAQSFEGIDARCEISGGWFAGRWALTGYLYLGKRLFRLNSPVANLRRFRVQAVGDQAGPGRRLAISYRSRRLGLRLIAEAPADTFVDLEREGATMIRTSSFASCALQISIAGQRQQLVARDRCLLEVKH